jgi:hypothetical protein
VNPDYDVPYSLNRSDIKSVQGGLRKLDQWLQNGSGDGAHSFLTALGERQIKVLWLPEGTEKLPKADQVAAAQRRIREHYQKTTGRYINPNGGDGALCHPFSRNRKASNKLGDPPAQPGWQ